MDRLLDPNPFTRETVAGVLKDPWVSSVGDSDDVGGTMSLPDVQRRLLFTRGFSGLKMAFLYLNPRILK